MLAATLALGAFAGSALGAADMRGTWAVHANLTGIDYPQAWVIASSDAATGVFAGASHTLGGGGSAGDRFGRVDGTVNPAGAVHLVNPYDVGSYTATFDGTLSVDATTITGGWSSNTGQTGTLTATRASSRRAVGMQVTCNTGPSPFDPATCTAQVGDAGPAPNTSAPSGIVTWVANTGALGSATCSLVTTPSSPTIASCPVTYRGGLGGIHPGTVLPVSASYAGDATFAPGAAGHQLLSGVPEQQDVCAPVDCSALGLRLPLDLDPALPPQLSLTNFCSPLGGVCTGNVSVPLTPAHEAAMKELDRINAKAMKEQAKRSEYVRKLQEEILRINEEVTRNKAKGVRPDFNPDDVYIRGFIDNSPSRAVVAFDRSAEAVFPSAGAVSTSREEASRTKIVPPRLVILAVTSSKPTRASAKAFDTAIAQATSPAPGKARTSARLTLETAAIIGRVAIAHDLRVAKGAKRKALMTLARTTLRVARGGHATVALRPTPFGGRVFRLLRLQALRRPVMLTLRLTGGRGSKRTVVNSSIALRTG